MLILQVHVIYSSLTEQSRVREECLWVVNLFFQGGINDVYLQKALANSVPAAAVIRRVQALFGSIGRKGRLGGLPSQV